MKIHAAPQKKVSRTHAPSPAAAPPAPASAAVRHILHSARPQAKLTVGAPDDAFEKEADQVADQVMRMPEPGVQRMCAECEGEEKEKIQAKEEPGRTPTVPGGFEQRFAALQGSGRPLPAAERAFFEPRFGRDFANVRLHSGPAANGLARSVHARAFTLGDSIVLGAGEGGEGGRELLAHELTHVVQQGGGAAQVQRVVDFAANFSNISLVDGSATTITGSAFNYEDAAFDADADVTATGDTEAELAEWDVGILQDLVGHWDRYYWRRNAADGRGRYVEKKYKPVKTRFRDQLLGQTTDWCADNEHRLLSSLAPAPSGARFRVSTTVHTHDTPSGPETTDGSAVPGMSAGDGTQNIDIQRTGARFDTWISAHNTVTDEWRHLRRLNWNQQRTLDCTRTGGTLAVDKETWQLGRHGPHRTGDAPRISGTRYNEALNDPAQWFFRRVNGWT